MYGKWLLSLWITVLLVSATVLAQRPGEKLQVVGSAWVLAPAVYQTDSGYAGSVTNITVFVTEGWGDVYVSTYSLTAEDFQGAATAAARVVAKLLNLDFSKYNYYFRVKSDAVIIGGPSAGVAMAVAVYSALTGAPINRSVMVTGMISPDGTVGPVGGIYEKAQAAVSQGAKVFLVPPGQSIVTTYRPVVRRIGPFRVTTYEPQQINLSDYAERNWGLKVVEISTIEDALRYFFNYRPTPPPAAAPLLSVTAREKIAYVVKTMLSMAQSELSDARRYVNASRLSATTALALRNYLDNYAAAYLSRASSLGSDAAAVFLSTMSVAYSRWVKYLVDYYLDRSLDAVVSQVSSEVSSLLSELENRGNLYTADLGFRILASDLVIRASRLLNESASTWSSDPVSALRNLAFASAMLDEAKLWAEGLPSLPGHVPVGVAESYISVARSTWSYAYSVLSEAGGDLTALSYSNTYLRAAMSMFSSGRKFSASVAGARSIALSEAALLSFQLSATGSRVYLRVASDQAKLAALRAADNVPALYFYNLSNVAASDSDKLVYLRLAAQLGNLLADIAEQEGISLTAQPPAYQAPHPAEPTPSAPEEPPERRGAVDIVQWIKDLLSQIALALENFLRWLQSLFRR
ncbi:MAG: S16 family serine protease [Thermofilum sp.]